MNQLITDEKLFEEFVEQIKVLVYAVTTQVPYTPKNITTIAFDLVEK